MRYADLTDAEQKFVDCYAGNATQAVIDAGLNKTGNRRTASATGSKLKAKLLPIIKERSAMQSVGRIMTRDDLMEWWTDRMQDAGEKIEIRVKCSELLGRALGVFIERRELTGTLTVAGLQAELEARRHG